MTSHVDFSVLAYMSMNTRNGITSLAKEHMFSLGLSFWKGAFSRLKLYGGVRIDKTERIDCTRA